MIWLLLASPLFALILFHFICEWSEKKHGIGPSAGI